MQEAGDRCNYSRLTLAYLQRENNNSGPNFLPNNLPIALPEFLFVRLGLTNFNSKNVITTSFATRIFRVILFISRESKFTSH